MDAILVALPQADGSEGRIFTCRNTRNPSPAAHPGPAPCDNQLIINGAVVARELHLGRTNGTVGSSTPREAANGNIGEIINFSPAFYAGAPEQQPISTDSYRSDSIIDLPPVF